MGELLTATMTRQREQYPYGTPVRLNVKCCEILCLIRKWDRSSGPATGPLTSLATVVPGSS